MLFPRIQLDFLFIFLSIGSSKALAISPCGNLINFYQEINTQADFSRFLKAVRTKLEIVAQKDPEDNSEDDRLQSIVQACLLGTENPSLNAHQGQFCASLSDITPLEEILKMISDGGPLFTEEYTNITETDCISKLSDSNYEKINYLL